ncbi:hypothetical protein M5K25_011009 [Dendrobium thyrsiflorum]|uniref:Uncharacterized protein n=1 Tax=Dendrobium thyrsiflorum TaxID=117978 RepID=A0ABD0V8L4_DENTH
MRPFGSLCWAWFSVAVPVPDVWDLCCLFGASCLAPRFPAIPCFWAVVYREHLCWAAIKCANQNLNFSLFLFSDENMIAQAIELNELLGKVLTQHDSLLSSRAPSRTVLFVNDEAEEDEELLLRRAMDPEHEATDGLDPDQEATDGNTAGNIDQPRRDVPTVPPIAPPPGSGSSEMFRRPIPFPPRLCELTGPGRDTHCALCAMTPWRTLRPWLCKGKALAEDNSEFLGSSLRHISDEELGRPLARPLCIQSTDQDSRPRLPQHPLGSIPPPPVKHMERERFFKEKHLDGPGIVGNMKSLSVHSRTGSSSRSGSTDSSDTIGFHG